MSTAQARVPAYRALLVHRPWLGGYSGIGPRHTRANKNTTDHAEALANSRSGKRQTKQNSFPSGSVITAWSGLPCNSSEPQARRRPPGQRDHRRRQIDAENVQPEGVQYAVTRDKAYSS